MHKMAKYKATYLVILLIVVVHNVCSWELPSESDSHGASFCARLFSQESFGGSHFQLEENAQVSNFPLFRNRIPGWEGNSTMSFKVTSGCSLSLATQNYLKGDVLMFDGRQEAISQDSIQSVACTCDQECDCTKIVLKQNECARAYLNTDCTHCSSYYTTMKQGSNQKFPEKFTESVKSVILRDGCKLQLLGDEDTVITETVNQAWYSNITQYTCSCDSRVPAKRIPKSTVSENASPMIDIPSARGIINRLLKLDANKDHPGLMAGLQSLRLKRSSSNAYILLLGLTGSGKSTTVNFLFDNPNITTVGGVSSTTTDILEFRIPVPVPELGIRNSELRIIDTPGIADTRGIEQDAQFLTTLEEYLAKHEELRNKIPNVILIFLNFNENRFMGEGSTFVKMLKTVELFRDKIMDRKYSNVVFVLTHYMSESKSITRDPSAKLASIRKVIQEQSTLPHPTILVVAENKPSLYDLPTLNGYYRLPNGEFYPQNLFSQIERVLVGAGDPVGNAIIRTAFQDAENFEIKSRPFPLLPITHFKVVKYLNTIAVLERPVDHTQVSKLLNAAYQDVDPALKAVYPETLNHLKRVCHVSKIFTANDVPKTTATILKFLKEVHHNPVAAILVQNGLNITVPIFKGNLVIGSGYDILKDRPLATTILDASDYYPTQIGFQLPSIIELTTMNQIEPVFQILTDREQYLQQRAPDLGLQDFEADSSIFSGTMKPGFNVIAQNQLSALLEYQIFHASLNNIFQLHPEFLSDVKLLKNFNQTDWDSVQAWKDFFQKYGTHIVVQGRGGGSIEIQVQTKSENFLASTPEGFQKLTEAMAEIVQYLANSFIGKETTLNISSEITYKIKMSGGEAACQFTNLSDSSLINPVDKWKESVQYEPVMLGTYLELLPITEILRLASRENSNLVSVSNEMDLAARALFNSSLVYIPTTPVRSVPNSRDRRDGGQNPIGDFGAVQEFANIFKSMQEQSQRMQESYMNILQQAQEDARREDEKLKQEEIEKGVRQAELDAIERDDKRFQDQLKLQREQLAAQTASEAAQIRIQMEARRRELEEQRATSQQQLQLQQQQIFMSFIATENQRISEERMNAKGWFESVVDVVKVAAPIALMARMG